MGEILDKLFLELSQVSNAKTAREIELERELRTIYYANGTFEVFSSIEQARDFRKACAKNLNLLPGDIP
jgi:hypothetical protein